MARDGRFRVALGLTFGGLPGVPCLPARQAGRRRRRQAVLREADVAMHTAKAHGKGRCELASTFV